MASREGTVVLLEELIRETIQRALEVVEQKNPELKTRQKQAVARSVGLGAVKFPMLARENTKIVTFDWETALDFNGLAAPYIQYAHVRANSIIRRQKVAERNHAFIYRSDRKFSTLISMPGRCSAALNIALTPDKPGI
jgi:arginyl-tRNA synthetase